MQTFAEMHEMAKRRRRWKWALYVAGVPLIVFWRGYAIAKLWDWFAVPLGVPPIMIEHAIGLILLFGVLGLLGSSSDEPFDLDARAKGLSRTFGMCAAALALGWALAEVLR